MKNDEKKSMHLQADESMYLPLICKSYSLSLSS